MISESIITSDEIPFPLLDFFKECFFIKRNKNELCGHWNQKAVRTKHYLGGFSVDEKLNVYRTLSAEVVCGEGPFWGYDLFWGRRVKVKLEFKVEPHGITFEEVKKKMRYSFRVWHGWKSNDSYGDVREAVRTSESMPQLLERLSRVMR